MTVNRLVKTNFITVCLHQKNDPVTFCFHPGLWNPLRAQQSSISDSHMLPIREPLRGPRQIPPIAPTPPSPTGFPSFPCCTSELACRPSPLLLPPPSPLHREGIYILIGRAAKWGYVLRQAAGNAPSCTSFQWTLQTIPGLVKMIFFGPHSLQLGQHMHNTHMHILQNNQDLWNEISCVCGAHLRW